MTQQSILFEDYELSIPAIRVEQPLGSFYIAALDAKVVREITHADVRRLYKERDFETYLGIQRPLSEKRVKEIQRFVTTTDACFPTSVILAVSGEYADFDESRSILTIRNFSTDSPDKKINRIEIAKVLDGQHRIEGLRNYSGKPFQINVAIFVDIDIEDQAYLFSTVNLAQTKVNKSLVYDLFDYAKSRSPQKTSHNIAVALDNQEGGPFHLRIKRLGAATPGRANETITQATFVEALMSHITADPIGDRNILLQGKKLRFCSTEESRALIFRNWFVEDKDMDIADVLLFYFSAVRERWPEAWNSTGAGMMLNKTNGFRALMRILRPAYLYFSAPGGKVQKEQFLTLFSKSKLRDADFNIDNFKPGTSGEGNLRNQLIEEMGLASIK